MFKFEQLQVYQKAVQFSFAIFTLTKSWPTTYRYSLIDQLQRASLSISLNIAEGSSRSPKDFQHFLSVARGSCYECIPLLTIGKKLQLITETECNQMYNEINTMAKMLSALRTSILSKQQVTN